jgi:glycosyltransferase 2 family protein
MRTGIQHHIFLNYHSRPLESKMTSLEPLDEPNPSSLSKNAAWTGWIISAVIVGIIAYSVDWNHSLQVVRKVPPLSMIVLVGIYGFGFIVRAARCELLLPELSFMTALKAVLVGYAANNILPARLGEFVRAHYVARRSTRSYASALANIAVERIFDGIILLILLSVGSMSLTLPPTASLALSLGTIIFAFAFVGFLLAATFATTLEAWIPEGSLKNTAAGFLDGMKIAARSSTVLLTTTVLSFAVWLIEASMFYAAFSSTGLDLPFSAALTVLGIINLGILIPSSPGYVGVFHSCAVLALQAYHIPPADALAYAIVVHLAQYMPVTIIGGLIYVQRNREKQ